MEKPGFYAILPSPVRYDRRLSASEKVFFAEITALSDQCGYCYAGNGYFSELYDTSDRTVQRWVKHLQELGYVAVTKGNEGRFCNLEDLRGSGTIEQDANSAIFVENRRTEDSKELRGEDAYQDTAVMYAKNREGPTGVVSMRWQPQYHQWQPTPKEEYEEIDQMNWPQ